MGTLAVEVSSDTGATWTSLWSMSGDQGNAWDETVVTEISPLQKFYPAEKSHQDYYELNKDINVFVTVCACTYEHTKSHRWWLRLGEFT